MAERIPKIDRSVFANLASLSGSNNSFLIDLISNFNTDAENDIRGMESSVAGRDWDAFRDYAHALKGGALYLGLARLAELSANAQHIEKAEFENNGITHILNIRQAADDALSELEIINSDLLKCEADRDQLVTR